LRYGTAYKNANDNYLYTAPKDTCIFTLHDMLDDIDDVTTSHDGKSYDVTPARDWLHWLALCSFLSIMLYPVWRHFENNASTLCNLSQSNVLLTDVHYYPPNVTGLTFSTHRLTGNRKRYVTSRFWPTAQPRVPRLPP